MGKIKILQVNLGRCRVAHDILFAIACERDIDIVIISEPNVKISSEYKYIMDKKNNVAMYVRNKDVGICNHSVGEGFVCLDLGEWCVYGCYCSPNVSLEEFKVFTDGLLRDVKNKNLDAVIAGDFNSKAAMWGSRITDTRGEHLMEWAAELDLNVVNTGDVPTFERRNSKSFIDITWSSSSMTNRIHNWEVLTGEVHTYHNYIYFEIEKNSRIRRREKGLHYVLEKENFARMLRSHPFGSKEITPNDFIVTVTDINRACMIPVSKGKSPMPYWWNSDIEYKRKECHHLRRRWTRHNKIQANSVEHPTEGQAYKQAKKDLKHLIIKAKRTRWNELRSDLENDIWREGFKIVRRHLGILPAPYNPSLEQKAKILSELCPKKIDNFIRSYKKEGKVPLFTQEELTEAVTKIKMGKSPGPDNITADAVRIMAEVLPDALLGVFNQLLAQQYFPDHWKEATVVLLPKGKATDGLCTYRPICLLSILGKLYERLIKNRLQDTLDKSGGLSDKQFGFVRGRSTVHAIRAVVQRIMRSKKPWVAMVALDIKNAFNSASWSKILNEMKRRNIPLFLTNIIEDYFNNRKIRLTRQKQIDITAGVPQGSVLGPILWNILYDGVLNLEMMDGVTTIAYADDLALIVEAEDSRDLMFKADESLDRIVEWMSESDLQIAAHKTEADDHKVKRMRSHVEEMQTRWSRLEATAQWTRVLTPDLVPWILCTHRKTDYFLTQFLTGHGYFRSYTERFKLSDDDVYFDCGEVDAPEHAVFVFAR